MIVHTNVNNVAAEKGFYDIEVEGGLQTMEPVLAHLEAKTSDIVKKITEKRTLQTLDKDEKEMLATFLAVQFVRTKEPRLKFKDLQESLTQKMRDMGATEDNIKEAIGNTTGLPEDTLIGFIVMGDVERYIPLFLNKVWVLFETTHEVPFFISDNPITLDNELDHSPYGSIGLAVRGIEIYVPISTTLSLGLFCPSIAKKWQKEDETIKMLVQTEFRQANQTIMNRLEVEGAFCAGLFNGTRVKLIEGYVTRMNSLQVMHSSRFVYCETDTFDLVRRMINDNDKYREGLKFTLS